MLTEVCDFVHNYFELEVHEGSFTISGGTIALDFLKTGQRFRIRGSALNDGIYTYSARGIYDDDGEEGVSLQSETFNGTVTAMGVPANFLAMVSEIKSWCTANAATLNSPYNSEAFGGYSYSKSGSVTGGSFTWRDQFRARLSAYRKIA